MENSPLEKLEPGMPIVFGGDRVARVPEDLAAAFRPGDALIVLQETGDLLHVPAAEREIVDRTVTRAVEAFGRMGQVSDEQIRRFYGHFAEALEAEAAFEAIAAANREDVARARERGR
ncbi:MAG: glutamate-5-semialdehyde dehydrogenase, partial [Actinomycetota bacterium]